MKINQIQSQLAINRVVLRHLHRELELDKAYRNDLRKDGQTMYADYYHKEVIKGKKRIATLAALQKALKKDLAQQIEQQRCIERAFRTIEAYKKSAMANVGEVFPHEFGKGF